MNHASIEYLLHEISILNVVFWWFDLNFLWMFQWNSICYVRIFLINYFPCFNDIFIFFLFGGIVVFHNLITECVKIRLSPGWTYPEADLMNKNLDNQWLIYYLCHYCATRAYEPYFSWRSVTTRSYITIRFMVNHTKSLIGIIGRKFRTLFLIRSGPETIWDPVTIFSEWNRPRFNTIVHIVITSENDIFWHCLWNRQLHPVYSKLQYTPKFTVRWVILDLLESSNVLRTYPHVKIKHINF